MSRRYLRQWRDEYGRDNEAVKDVQDGSSRQDEGQHFNECAIEMLRRWWRRAEVERALERG